MRVLLTGAAGFIGTATARELRRHDVEVVAVDLLLPQAHGEATRATPPPEVHVLDTRRAGEWTHEDTGVDGNVIFLLLGMMIIVSIVKQTGVFEYLAIWSAKRARGRPFAVMVMLILITAVASALLDNVTTVLLVAPVTGAADHRARRGPGADLPLDVPVCVRVRRGPCR
jgi:hypothetical protein